MSKEILKKLNVQISHDAWKKLKILSIQKDISLPELVKNILERSAKQKIIEMEEVVS
jgi:hypothetical protein